MYQRIITSSGTTAQKKQAAGAVKGIKRKPFPSMVAVYNGGINL